MTIKNKQIASYFISAQINAERASKEAAMEANNLRVIASYIEGLESDIDKMEIIINGLRTEKTNDQ